MCAYQVHFVRRKINLNDNENYGGQVVAIRKDIRALICDEWNIKERAFYNNIKKLTIYLRKFVLIFI